MDEMDGGTHMHMHVLEQHIVEVETRLGMLRDQIAAMLGDDGGSGEQSGLVYSAIRTLQALEQLRREIREDTEQAALGNGSIACVAPHEHPQEHQATQ
jgi:hypothetical protein